MGSDSLLESDKVYGVAELTLLVKGLLEEYFGSVWVEGEISNYKHHSSGHRYFSLKDESASLRCVMWRTTARRLRFEPADGQRVRAFGSMTVYPPQGSYQLVVSQLVDAGIGPLEIAFQKLKEKLLKEGLFDVERKRPLPVYPATVGVVTSPTGAAVVDITETIAQRFPGMTIILTPVRVQGEGAAEQIVAAIGALNRRDDIDVLIVGRGGGSLEHEVDFTIADGVADFRAPTPTAAAERITDGWVRVRHELPQIMTRLDRAVRAGIGRHRQQWERLQNSHALRRPADLMHLWSQRLDDTTERLERAAKLRADYLSQRVESMSGRLNALAPKAVLQRGYSITRILGESNALRDVSGLAAGMTLETTLSAGRLVSELTEATETRKSDNPE
jgi:exodeoxyribonuclease VII large subunit